MVNQVNNDKQRNRILLFHCARYNRLTPIITMGLWGLADYATKQGFPTTIIHTNVEAELHGAFDIQRYLSPDVLIVGFSLHWFPMAAEALDVAEAVKKIDPGIFVVFGGFTASYFFRHLLEGYTAIDGILRGDSEIPLVELARSLTTKSRLEEVPNLAWRHNDQLIENAFTYVSSNEQVKDVSFGKYAQYLENYEFAKTSVSFAQSSALVADFEPDFPLTPMFYLLTGKGCAVDCSMCGGGKAAQYIMNHRERSLFLDEQVILRTINEGIALGYKNFYVCFDPTPEKPHYFYWLRAIRNAGLDINLSFGFWGLPTAEAINEIRLTSRNVLVDLSPETISERTRIQNKGIFYSNEQLLRTIDMLYQERIYTHIYFSYFLPYQTEQELADTRRAYWEFNTEYPHYIEATILKISTDPCSPLYRNPGKFDVSLTVKDIDEHIALCRENPRSNIHVHDVHTLPPDVQERYERIFTYDTTIKRLFRYHIKLFVRCFPSLNRFISFLDAFYTQYDLLYSESVSKQFKTLPDIMCKLAEFVKQEAERGGRIDPYAVDLTRYLHAIITVRERASESSSAQRVQEGDLAAMIPQLSAHSTVLELRYNCYRMNQYLRKQKQFPPIAASPGKFFISAVNKQPVIFQINDTMYYLCKALQENKTITIHDLLQHLAAEYSDDPGERDVIQADFLKTIMQLAEKGYVQFSAERNANG